MNFQADFLDEGECKWGEVPHSKRVSEGVQSAMFIDRPDLWPCVPKGKRSITKPLEGQTSLFETSELENKIEIIKGGGRTYIKISDEEIYFWDGSWLRWGTGERASKEIQELLNNEYRKGVTGNE